MCGSAAELLNGIRKKKIESRRVFSFFIFHFLEVRVILLFLLADFGNELSGTFIRFFAVFAIVNFLGAVNAVGTVCDATQRY